MPTAMCHGVNIYYEERGAGPLILFLHGVGGNAKNWEPQLAALSDSFRVVAWNARGYGQSDDPPTPIAQRDFATDARDLLDHLGVQQAHILGLSMGGMIAQEFYRHFPERARSLILADTVPGFGSIPNKDEVLAERLKDIDNLSIEEAARRRAPKLLAENPDPNVLALMEQSMSDVRREPYRQAWVSMFEVNFLDLLPNVGVPTLIICGREDKVTPLKQSETMHRLIPGSQLLVLDRAGHMSNLEKPKEFNHAVRGFVTQVEATGKAA